MVKSQNNNEIAIQNVEIGYYIHYIIITVKQFFICKLSYCFCKNNDQNCDDNSDTQSQC